MMKTGKFIYTHKKKLDGTIIANTLFRLLIFTCICHCIRVRPAGFRIDATMENKKEQVELTYLSSSPMITMGNEGFVPLAGL